MNVKAVQDHCAALPGVASTIHAAPSNILVYEVGGKKFAYFKTSEPERWRFSIRTSPDRFLELTGMPGIKPARYMARFRWVTIVHVGSMPADYLRELIAWSYAAAVSSLPKREQAALAGIAA